MGGVLVDLRGTYDFYIRNQIFNIQISEYQVDTTGILFRSVVD